MTERYVYLVRGEFGEYEDRTQWFVGGHDTEAAAQAHADRANQWCLEHHLHTSTPTALVNPDDAEDNPHDPAMQDLVRQWTVRAYTGVEYDVIEVAMVPPQTETRA